MHCHVPALVVGLLIAFFAIACSDDAAPAGGQQSTDSGAMDTADAGSSAVDASKGVADGGLTDSGPAADSSATADTCGCPHGTSCQGDTCAPLPKTCKLPTSWGPALQKMNTFGLFAATEGCDLTGDGKPDNAMGAIKALAGKAIEHSVSSGDVKLILEAVPWKTDKSPVEIRMLSSSLVASDPSCAFNKDVCTYTIGKVNYDVYAQTTGTCPPVTSMKGAAIDGSKLAGGGKGYGFVIPIPVAGAKLEIPFVNAKIEGTVADKAAWKSTKDGKLCGVIPRADLFKALDKVPEAQLKAIGGKEAAKNLLDGMLKADIDLDEDGTKDGISAGFSFTTIGAKVVGITPDK